MSRQREMKSYKGYIMLLGLFRIRRDFAFWIETDGTPYACSRDYFQKLEPIIQKFCTIKWIETDEKETELCFPLSSL